MDRDKIKQAINEYGEDVVDDVLKIVEVSDPDGAYTFFQDEGLDAHAEAVELIYFNYEI